MSTRIYNAYKINVGSIGGFRDFAQTLSTEYFWDRYARYVEAAATAVAILMEYVPYLSKKDPMRHERITKETARLSMASIPDKQPALSKAKKIIAAKPVFEIAQSAVCGKWAKDESNPIDADIIAFPCPMAIKKRESNNPTLIIAFGKGLEDFLSQAYKISRAGFNPSGMAYKYSLRDWHYQDQTDKPADVSDDEWMLRLESWTEAMPTDDPRRDGLLVSILDMETFKVWLAEPKYDYDYADNDNSYGNIRNKSRLDADMVKILGGSKDMAKRLAKYAEADALDEYATAARRADEGKRSPGAIYARLKREFDATKDDPSSAAYELVAKYKAEISPYVIDFSSKDPLGIYCRMK